VSRRAGFIALTLLAAFGCAAGGSSGLGGTGAGGSSGSLGTGGSANPCLKDDCVPLLLATDMLAVEIAPPSASPSAVTQILNRDVSSTASYLAGPAATVTASFAAVSGASVPSSANVVLTVPPTIPGRPDLSFQSLSSPTKDSGQSVSATLSVPQDAVGNNATLSFVPLPPSDQSMPAYTYALPIATQMAVNLPGDDIVVSGQIQTAVQQPPPSTFVARAFQSGAQVSDSAQSNPADGTFQLRIPAAATANPVTIQLSPIASAAGVAQDAWFVSNPITVTPGKNLGAISLPSYQVVASYDVVVAFGSLGIPGANVRAQASLGSATTNSSSTGTATYLSSGTTGSSGIAALAFLPGSASAPIPYGVTATPPVGSPYASACAKNVKPLPGSGSATTIATIMPTMRPVLSGTVSSNGIRVPNVTVTASGSPDPLDAACPNPPAVTANTTTDANGAFSLPLDPGTYQIDFDPPAGSFAPRFTLLSRSVTAYTTIEPLTVDVGAGVRVMGTVVGRLDGAPVASATVRFYLPRCMGQTDCFGPGRTPPLLIGKALTAPDGSFRMIIPAP
jgi:hypothetical protein